jgi:hypothetical protein
VASGDPENSRIAPITIAMAREFSDILGHRIGGLKRVDDRNVYDKILFFRRAIYGSSTCSCTFEAKEWDAFLSSSLSVTFILALASIKTAIGINRSNIS